MREDILKFTKGWKFWLEIKSWYGKSQNVFKVYWIL